MITLEDFKDASFDQKCSVVTMDSDYLTMRKTGDSKIHLYYTGGFFIEVHYSPAQHQVLMINAFNGPEDLLPYAESVSLADLNL